jgi:hypothetical protein
MTEGSVMSQDNEQEQLNQLISLIQVALQRDEQLRQTHQIGERFRFVRDRLQTLLETIEKESAAKEKQVKVARTLQLAEDEILVYIHLYNAQGALVRTWQAMITPKAFFDFSVNRPIYQEMKHIEAFIRAKSNKTQHAYLTVAMKKERILPPPEEGMLKDSLENPLTKVKEGSLRYERLVSFTHNEIVYELNETGELIKKNSESITTK